MLATPETERKRRGACRPTGEVELAKTVCWPEKRIDPDDQINILSSNDRLLARVVSPSQDAESNNRAER